jgi:hypothetical protein
MTQYLQEPDIINMTGKLDIQTLTVRVKDTYSDVEILKSIKATGKIRLLLAASLQLSIVGSGNKSFGEFNLDGETFDVLKLFKSTGVKTDLIQDSKLQPGDITPKRLQRVFRYHIKKYLSEKNLSTYLWRKYSTQDEKFKFITFLGAESLITSKDEALFLLMTYQNLDQQKGTNIANKIANVLVSRQIINLSEVPEMKFK